MKEKTDGSDKTVRLICEEKMRNKSDKLPGFKKFRLAAVLIAAVLLISFVFVEKRMRDFSEEAGAYYCKAYVSQTVNDAVLSVLSRTGAEYSDLSDEIYSDDGNFISAKINTNNINILQSMIISEINNRLSESSENTLKISAGTISGSFLLNGRGPKIEMKLTQVGSAQSELKSEFESGGINQTHHTISIDIKTEVKAVYPFGSENVTVNTNCLLAENIIAGEVPQGFYSPLRSKSGV